MQIDDMTVDDLERIQHAANETMTKVLLVKHEIVGKEVSALTVLRVEPMILEVEVNA